MHHPLTRRRFVEGLASFALAAGALRSARAATLQGTTFDLTVGAQKINITGAPATAITVNGSLPGPTLLWQQGDTVTLNVRNTLATPTSIHWHGIRAPAGMDGVPGLSFPGIPPNGSFTYRMKLHQAGTYWYHSHSDYQEQQGLYGAIIVAPRSPALHQTERDYTILLSDWTDTAPEQIVSNLKFQSDYYNFDKRDARDFLAGLHADGLSATLKDRVMWGGMRMSATDISDVSGAAYTYLLNGHPPAANWTALFRPGERVRLRFINASSMTFFDIRIPGLPLTIIQADGNDVEPITVDEFRIGVAETYDVIVRPNAGAHTIFAQSQDRTGFARATLTSDPSMAAPIPPMDKRPVRGMADMGMAMGGKMDGMKMDASMPGMDMSAPATTVPPTLHGAIGVDNIAAAPSDRLSDPGGGLNAGKRRALAYTDLRATRPGADPRPPSRDITLHLTGNMMRYIWGFDGRKFSQAEPIRLALGERVRFILINDTMMEHPIHLHGLWSELENGQDELRPYKHTVIAQPGAKLSYLVTADTPGMWAFHCHLLYHMEMGMMRTVIVA